jgi:hypothetical protein
MAIRHSRNPTLWGTQRRPCSEDNAAKTTLRRQRSEDHEDPRDCCRPYIETSDRITMNRSILLAALTAATCLLSSPGRAAQVPSHPCDSAALNPPCERPLPPCEPSQLPCLR